MSGFKTFIYPLAVLSGTIIGVGLFGLPYITAKIGFWPMFGYLLALAPLVIIIHLFYGELAVKTADFKRLPGFAKIYLGRWGQGVALVSTVFGLTGSLLAYLIVGGQFLKELFFPVFGGNTLTYTLFYFIIGAALIYFGIKAIAKVELWGLILFFLILVSIYLRGHSFLDTSNLFPIPDWSFVFLPYGAIIFSLWGASLIPEIEEMLGKEKKLIKTVIFTGMLIPVTVYLLFIYLILGITGEQTSESALAGLKAYLGDGVVIMALILGLITTFTSFLTLGLTLKKVFNYDLNFNHNLSWVLTCFIPLGLFLVGVKSFISVMAVVGGVMLAVDGILILLMYQKVHPRKRVLVYPLILVLLGGIIYSFVHFS